MAVIVTKNNFSQEVEQSKTPVLVDMLAPWCTSCQHMMPLFEELAKELGGTYKFVKVNVDEDRDLAIKFGVTSIPTFLFFKNGKVVGKEVGVMSKQNLQESFERSIK